MVTRQYRRPAHEDKNGKTCVECGKYKTWDGYSWHKQNQRFRPTCKECVRALRKVYYERTKAAS